MASSPDDRQEISQTKLTREQRAAGMDLKELIQISTAEAHQRNFLKDLTDAFARFSKPSIAAVVGFAVSKKWLPRVQVIYLLGRSLEADAKLL